MGIFLKKNHVIKKNRGFFLKLDFFTLVVFLPLN